MGNDNTKPSHHLIQQTISHFSTSLKPLPLLAAILLLTTASGISGYWLGIRMSRLSPHDEFVYEPSPTTNMTTRTVIIHDAYYFQVSLPHGYALKEGDGSYIRYVTNTRGKNIVGFYISSFGGERYAMGRTHIDNVPFTVDYTYRGVISCPADLYATDAQFTTDHLYFGIVTWCKDPEDAQNGVYERIITSIKFSEDLRAVLLGNTPPPMLRY